MTAIQVIASIFIIIVVGSLIGLAFSYLKKKRDIRKAPDRIKEQKYNNYQEFSEITGNTPRSEGIDPPKKEEGLQEAISPPSSKKGRKQSVTSSEVTAPSPMKQMYDIQNKQLTDAWIKKKEEWREKRKLRKEKKKKA